MQARVVGVQLEGLVEEVRPERLERVHHGEKLQQMGRVRPFRRGQLARFEGHRMELAGVVGLLKDGRDGELVAGQARTVTVTDLQVSQLPPACHCAKTVAALDSARPIGPEAA